MYKCLMPEMPSSAADRDRVSYGRPAFLRGVPVEEYMANVITQFLKHRDQASGLKAHGVQLADGGPPESVAGLGAVIQIAVRQSGRPGEAVVETDFVLEGAVTVDVLHDQCQSPSRELVPELFGWLTRQGTLSWLPETDPAAGQEPVPKPVNGS